jgi:hypothetical protein
LYEQHDTQWIDDGYPGEGNIIIFNNGVGRGYSTVDEITPPVLDNGSYYLEDDSAYGPAGTNMDLHCGSTNKFLLKLNFWRSKTR